MNNDLREHLLCEYNLKGYEADELITLIRTATLDAMQAETDEIEKSELWAQMGIPAECQGVYVEKFEEAIDNLRDDAIPDEIIGIMNIIKSYDEGNTYLLKAALDIYSLLDLHFQNTKDKDK